MPDKLENRHFLLYFITNNFVETILQYTVFIFNERERSFILQGKWSNKVPVYGTPYESKY